MPRHRSRCPHPLVLRPSSLHHSRLEWSTAVPSVGSRQGGRRAASASRLVAACAGIAVFFSPAAHVAHAADHGLPAASLQQVRPTAATPSNENDVCTISPRPLEEFAAISGEPGYLVSPSRGTPVATMIPPSGGVAADAATADAVTTTMREWVACLNSGGLRRSTALHTDRFFRYLYGGLDERAIRQLAATPAPLAPDQRAVLEAISDVRLHDDGRVSAVTQVSGRRALTLFAEENGRYLIDGSFPAPPATPTP